MLINLFQTVRSAGVPCTLRELLDLLGALEKNMVYANIDDFYYLSRAILVKDEKHYDKFDKAFDIYFKGIEKLGDRFVDMSDPYDFRLMGLLETISQKQNIKLNKGVYASVVGPQLETRAEYRMLKILGADAVGMSTVPEVIVAKQLSLHVAAISVLTDECDPNNLSPINIPEIMEIVEKTEPHLVILFTQLIKNL
jgi:purine nucleoside phosphorylase